MNRKVNDKAAAQIKIERKIVDNEILSNGNEFTIP